MRNAIELISVPLLAYLYYYITLAVIGIFAALPIPSFANAKDSPTLFMLYDETSFILSIILGAVLFAAISAFFYKTHMLAKATAIAVPTFCIQVYESTWVILNANLPNSVATLSETLLFAISIPAFATLFSKIPYNQLRQRTPQAPPGA